MTCRALIGNYAQYFGVQGFFVNVHTSFPSWLKVSQKRSSFSAVPITVISNNLCLAFRPPRPVPQHGPDIYRILNCHVITTCSTRTNKTMAQLSFPLSAVVLRRSEPGQGWLRIRYPYSPWKPPSCPLESQHTSF